MWLEITDNPLHAVQLSLFLSLSVRSLFPRFHSPTFFLCHCPHSALELIRMCTLLPHQKNTFQERHITPKAGTPVKPLLYFLFFLKYILFVICTGTFSVNKRQLTHYKIVGETFLSLYCLCPAIQTTLHPSLISLP